MRRRGVLWVLALAWIMAGGLGCGESKTLPDPKPMPAGTDVSGVWYSENFEQMYLRQTGDEVRGIYSYKYGGTLEGKLNGNLLTFVWIDPGDKSAARRSVKGKGYLQIKSDGEKIKMSGEWGYGDKYWGGGPWKAEYIRQIEAEDPRTLEELKKKEGSI